MVSMASKKPRDCVFDCRKQHRQKRVPCGDHGDLEILSKFQDPIYADISDMGPRSFITRPWQEEMVHLNNVDRPGSDVDAYVNGLDRILRLKA